MNNLADFLSLVFKKANANIADEKFKDLVLKAATIPIDGDAMSEIIRDLESHIKGTAIKSFAKHFEAWGKKNGLTDEEINEIIANHDKVSSQIEAKIAKVLAKREKALQDKINELTEKFKKQAEKEEPKTKFEDTELYKELQAQIASLKKDAEEKIKEYEQKLQLKSEALKNKELDLFLSKFELDEKYPPKYAKALKQEALNNALTKKGLTLSFDENQGKFTLLYAKDNSPYHGSDIDTFVKNSLLEEGLLKTAPAQNQHTQKQSQTPLNKQNFGWSQQFQQEIEAAKVKQI